jgi:cysteinyl-tRNA synthetase, unknown class
MVTNRPVILLALMILIVAPISGCITGKKATGGERPPLPGVYADKMRGFVQNISSYAKAQDPDFIIIPQNGHGLLTSNGLGNGTPEMTYIHAIDGVGQEDMYYGYDADNKATPSEVSALLKGRLDVAKNNGIQALVIDYCSEQAKMDDSYSKNKADGFISFAADHRALDNIPAYPVQPFGLNSDNITSLKDAKNFLYIINPEGYASKEAFFTAVKATNFDVIIVDAFFNDVQLTKDEVSSLKVKANGGTRLVISYMSIGEAENYRYYWQAGWKTDNPSFLDKENPDWKGNYKVRYWEKSWQDVIYGNNASYTKRLLDSGFDGAYLDIIDAYEYYEE